MGAMQVSDRKKEEVILTTVYPSPVRNSEKSGIKKQAIVEVYK